MNLKEAARLLGVSYQTAYRHVRSGELVAVKVGARYEVSQAAVAQLSARQAALRQDPTSPPELTVVVGRASGPPEDGAVRSLLELDRMVDMTTLSARPVLDEVARHAAHHLGDAAILRLLSDDGAWLSTVAFHHRDPTRRPTLGALVDAQLHPATGGLLAPAVEHGLVVHIDHVDQEALRREYHPSLRGFLAEVGIFSLLAVPITSSKGLSLGVLTVTRDRPGHVYSADDELLLIELAARASAALDAARRFGAAWFARNSLVESVEALLAASPAADDANLLELVLELLQDDIPELVFDPDGTLLAATEAAGELLGIPFDAFLGRRLAELPGLVCLQSSQEDLWERLLAGDHDYLDQLARACTFDCPASRSAHWAVVRRFDATPALVLATFAAAPGAATPDPSAPSTPQCLGLCRPIPLPSRRPAPSIESTSSSPPDTTWTS